LERAKEAELNIILSREVIHQLRWPEWRQVTGWEGMGSRMEPFPTNFFECGDMGFFGSLFEDFYVFNQVLLFWRVGLDIHHPDNWSNTSFGRTAEWQFCLRKLIWYQWPSHSLWTKQRNAQDI
jgi:hypothetical protein